MQKQELDRQRRHDLHLERFLLVLRLVEPFGSTQGYLDLLGWILNLVAFVYLADSTS
jgi:hypothetical protein